jgi:hypothetical protein
VAVAPEEALRAVQRAAAPSHHPARAQQEPAPAPAADREPEVVAEDRSADRDSDHRPDVQVAGARENPGGEQRGLARHR